MRRKKLAAPISAALVLALLMTALLSGCGGNSRPAAPAEPVSSPAPVSPAAPDEPAAAEADAGRQDGERFEEVILLEGMEETVQYEHVRNEAVGFALDYEVELLARRTEADRDCFVSIYDLPDDPWNYLELTRTVQDADAAAASLSAALLESFDTVVEEPVSLALAGSCVRLSASGARADKLNPGALQTVYIIPAADGCLVAAAHCTVESAEGFGARFSRMLNTLTVLDR